MSEKEEKLLVRKATINLKRKYGRTKKIDVVERDAYIPVKLEKEISDIESMKPIIKKYRKKQKGKK